MATCFLGRRRVYGRPGSWRSVDSLRGARTGDRGSGAAGLPISARCRGRLSPAQRSLCYGLVLLRLPKSSNVGECAMRLVLLRRIPDEPSLRRKWNGLVMQMERPEVFYTCEWALAMQSAYQSSITPL